MKTTICLFNDRVVPMHVNVQSIDREPWDHVFVTIEPQELQYITYEIHHDEVPYVKVWESNTVFVSSMPKEKL